MLENIRAEADLRGISRLCHFTSSANFLHVLRAAMLKDRATLDSEANPVVNPTDALRLDGHTDKICCSVEYPNAYYLDTARKKNLVFTDWIVVLLNPELLWQPGTVFCRRNAAAQNGMLIKPGEAGFKEMFWPEVDGAGGRRFTRAPRQLTCSTTDVQAEVLVPGPIPLADVLGIIVQSQRQGETELARWESLGLDSAGMKVAVAPTLFDKFTLGSQIRSGLRPPEATIAV